jgi:hypothetical protein
MWSWFKSIPIQHFWYLRVRHLLGDKELTFRDGDWKVAYYELEACLCGVIPLSSAVDVESDTLTIQLLLELGYNPTVNDNNVILAATITKQKNTLRLLLSSSKVDSKTFDSLCILFRLRTNLFSLGMLDMLIGDERFKSALDTSQKQLLHNLFVGRCAAITDAIREGAAQVVRYCLECKIPEPHAFNLAAAVIGGHTKIACLLLEDGRVDPRDASYDILGSLGCQSVEMLRLFQADGRLDVHFNSITIVSAVRANNIDIIRELLPSSCPTSLMNTLHCRQVSTHLSILDLLLSDHRLDINHLPYSELLIIATEPLILKRLLAAYSVCCSSPLAKGTKSMYVLFLHTLIISRPSPRDAIAWLKNHRDAGVRRASRSVLDGSLVCGKFQEAFRGYFLCIAFGYTPDEMKGKMRDDGCSSLGIKLASRLVCAQYEYSERLVSSSEYRQAFKCIFGM